jgi:SHAQKYF class myb-like DNA-binding protein
LALLQSPGVQQPVGRTNPQTLAAASALASLQPSERQRSSEQDEDKEASKQKDRNSTTFQLASSTSRPRKRVIFLGDTGDDNDVEESDAWTAGMHRSFVQAVYETGTHHASPSVLLDHMINADNFPLTSERVKSRLQKYRNNSEKSLAEFMQEYDTFLQRALSIGRQSMGPTTSLLPLANVLLILGQEEPLYGGDAAAAVTYNLLYKQSQGRDKAASPASGDEYGSVVARMLTPASLKNNSTEFTAQCHGQKVLVPRLTEEEKSTALGESFEHIKGTFVALVEELKRQREKNSSEEACTHVEADAKIDAKKPKAMEARVGSKAIHNKEDEGSQGDDASNAPAENKQDEMCSIVAEMYEHRLKQGNQKNPSA